MIKQQLAKELKDRLSALLEDSVFAETSKNRANQKQGTVMDSLARHNFDVSEEILNLNESSVTGTVADRDVNKFRRFLTDYMKKNGSGDKIYDEYITIICEYQALVVNQPLHPLAVRHYENNPPEDREECKYCCLKSKYVRDPGSLCHLCVCSPWPESPEE